MKRYRRLLWAVVLVCGVTGGAHLRGIRAALAEDEERTIPEAEAPAAALAALQALAGGAPISAIEREVAHGQTYYEGSWQGASGMVEAEVTESGELVEIEERLAAEQVPDAVREAVARQVKGDAEVQFEKVTLILYEAKVGKGRQSRELVFTADGRRFAEDDDDDDNEDDDD